VTSSTPTRLKAETAGRRAEQLAAFYLQLKGYVILDRRVKTGRGEVDLIVRRGKILAFVEVKMRTKPSDPATLLAPRQRNRIVNGATGWAGQRAWASQCAWRYDLIVIVPWRWPDHIKDAWRPQSDPTLATGPKTSNVSATYSRRK
jgi:putative endonuclease